MDYPKIRKQPAGKLLPFPNLSDYQTMYDDWSWEKVSAELDWFDNDHINICHIAIDCHVAKGNGNKKALIWQSTKGAIEEYTFADLSRLSNKFANALKDATGLQKGDRVFFFLERVPEIFVSILEP